MTNRKWRMTFPPQCQKSPARIDGKTLDSSLDRCILINAGHDRCTKPHDFESLNLVPHLDWTRLDQAEYHEIRGV